MPSYSSLADIDTDFTQRINQADEGDRPALREAHANAKVEFLSSQLQARDLQAARAAALQEFPLAAQFEDMIQGATADEIKASAKTIHERIQAIAPPTTPEPPAAPPAPQGPDPATLAYGQPGVGGAGAPSPPPDREAELFRKMVGAGGGKGRSMTRAESDEYVRSRSRKVLKETLDNKGVFVGLGPGVNPRNADR